MNAAWEENMEGGEHGGGINQNNNTGDQQAQTTRHTLQGTLHVSSLNVVFLEMRWRYGVDFIWS